MHKLNSFESVANSARDWLYIVGSFSKETGFSVSSAPAAHLNASQARAECARLANLNPDKAFVFLRVSGMELLPRTQRISV